MEGLVVGGDCKAGNLLLRQLGQQRTASLVRIWRRSRQHRHLMGTTCEKAGRQGYVHCVPSGHSLPQVQERSGAV